MSPATPFVMFMQFLAILPNIFPHKSTTPNRKSCIVKRKFSCKKFAFFHFASFIIMKWNYYEMEIETRIMVHYLIIIYIYIYIYNIYKRDFLTFYSFTPVRIIVPWFFRLLHHRANFAKQIKRF